MSPAHGDTATRSCTGPALLPRALGVPEDEFRIQLSSGHPARGGSEQDCGGDGVPLTPPAAPTPLPLPRDLGLPLLCPNGPIQERYWQPRPSHSAARSGPGHKLPQTPCQVPGHRKQAAPMHGRLSEETSRPPGAVHQPRWPEVRRSAGTHGSWKRPRRALLFWKRQDCQHRGGRAWRPSGIVGGGRDK